jgi:hypothetical protein
MAVTFGCVLSQASQQTFSDKRSQASVTHFAPIWVNTPNAATPPGVDC